MRITAGLKWDSAGKLLFPEFDSRTIVKKSAGFHFGVQKHSLQRLIEYTRNIIEGKTAYNIPDLDSAYDSKLRCIPIRKIFLINDNDNWIKLLRSFIELVVARGFGIELKFIDLAKPEQENEGALTVYTATNRSGFENIPAVLRGGERALIFMDYNLGGEGINGASLTAIIREREKCTHLIIADSNSTEGKREIIKAGGTCCYDPCTSLYELLMQLLIGKNS